MSEKRTPIEVKTNGPSYLDWRGELLAELALARIPGLIVHKRPKQPASDFEYDFLVATEHGGCLFVEVKAFASFRLEVEDISTVKELRWAVDADFVRKARESQNPIVLFLFDADTEHGRFQRLDTLPAPNPDLRRLTIRFPVEQTIDTENLERVFSEREWVPHVATA